MVLEEQRFIHEDLERLEQAIADRVGDEPRNVSGILPRIFLSAIWELMVRLHRFAIASRGTTKSLTS